jgi:hypothetical protein
MARDERGLLDMREVPAPIHHDEARVRQALLPQRRVGRRHDLVIVAPDDQRRLRRLRIFGQRDKLKADRSKGA